MSSLTSVTKPFLTTDDLVAAIQRNAAIPLSQNLFMYADFLFFLNTEVFLSIVPELRLAHEEYFVYKHVTNLVNGISRYGIPERAQGMTIRDLKYSDSLGNFYDMFRIAPDDKAFFQQSNGSNQTVAKYYLEGNEIVLTPNVNSGATGQLNFFIFLRPNSLVRNDRAAIIQNYEKDITISNNSYLEVGDSFAITTGNQSTCPQQYPFFAVTAINPLENYLQFVIGASASATALNLNNAINAANIPNVTSAISPTDNTTLNIVYYNISDAFFAAKVMNPINPIAFTIDSINLTINFNQFPSTYTDPDTQITTPLYVVGAQCDFLQTNPGHRTYTYDIPIVSINGTQAKFAARLLQGYQNNSSGGQLSYFNIRIGDYICLANECIIPQIPPELHNALAERAASRVMLAIGDSAGYAASKDKIAEMNKYQATLIDSRVESSVPKVFNRMSMLRMGKSRFRRRY